MAPGTNCHARQQHPLLTLLLFFFPTAVDWAASDDLRSNFTLALRTALLPFPSYVDSGLVRTEVEAVTIRGAVVLRVQLVFNTTAAASLAADIAAAGGLNVIVGGVAHSGSSVNGASSGSESNSTVVGIIVAAALVGLILVVAAVVVGVARRRRRSASSRGAKDKSKAVRLHALNNFGSPREILDNPIYGGTE